MSDEEVKDKRKNLDLKALLIVVILTLLSLLIVYFVYQFGEPTGDVQMTSGEMTMVLSGSAAVFIVVFIILVKSFKQITKILLTVLPILLLGILAAPLMFNTVGGDGSIDAMELYIDSAELYIEEPDTVEKYIEDFE